MLIILFLLLIVGLSYYYIISDGYLHIAQMAQ